MHLALLAEGQIVALPTEKTNVRQEPLPPGEKDMTINGYLNVTYGNLAFLSR